MSTYGAAGGVDEAPRSDADQIRTSATLTIGPAKASDILCGMHGIFYPRRYNNTNMRTYVLSRTDIPGGLVGYHCAY